LLPFTALIEYKAINKLAFPLSYWSCTKREIKKKKSAAAAKVVINPTFVPTIRVFSF
jgi:hypothetical protein